MSDLPPRGQAQRTSASALREDVIASISNEIRTPLSGILGMARLLAETALNPEQKGFVEAIRSASESLLNIVGDLVDLSRMEAGKLALDNVDFDLGELADDALDMVQSAARDKGLGLSAAIAPSVDLSVRGDPGRLRQVLVNLLDNAVKHTDHGFVTLTIEPVSSMSGRQVVRFTISDTGVGVPPEIAQRLFQRPAQGDGLATRRPGAGLGLYVCKQLATIMQGEVGVRSAPGQGSSFWLTASLAHSDRPTPKLRPEQVRGKDVLVVDTSAADRAALREQIEALGLGVVEARSPQEALSLHAARAVEGRPPAVIFIARQMPMMDGLRLTRVLRAQPEGRKVPIVLLTAEGATDRDLAAGVVDAVLSKPTRARRTAAALRRVLDISHTPVGLNQPETPLPVTSLPPGPPPSPTPSLSARPPATPLGHVLLAEDNPVNQKVAVGMLTRLGYSVDVAADGREAVEALRRRPYDLILMDCQMPVMDGYDAARAIRQLEGANLPILALTADVTESNHRACIASGMNEVLFKPVTREVLGTAVNRWISRRRRGRPERRE